MRTVTKIALLSFALLLILSTVVSAGYYVITFWGNTYPNVTYWWWQHTYTFEPGEYDHYRMRLRFTPYEGDTSEGRLEYKVYYDMGGYYSYCCVTVLRDLGETYRERYFDLPAGKLIKKLEVTYYGPYRPADPPVLHGRVEYILSMWDD